MFDNICMYMLVQTKFSYVHSQVKHTLGHLQDLMPGVYYLYVFIPAKVVIISCRYARYLCMHLVIII